MSLALPERFSSDSVFDWSPNQVVSLGNPARRRVLIVSPNFPPVDSADMQRVRMSLPYFREFGWEPYVLAVAPDRNDTLEPLFMDTLDTTIGVERVRAIPRAITRTVGIGNVALRSLPFLFAAGSRLIKHHRIELVYFSTTMFMAMPLGRLWHARFGVPYVLDMQDPWVSDYYDTHPDATPPRKYGLAKLVHKVLEPFTMARVGGIVAVSEAYIKVLRRRYRGIDIGCCATIPFAASQADFDLLDRKKQPNRIFERGGAHTVGVYVGRGGDDMKAAARLLCGALERGLATAPALFEPIKLHFVGTDYADAARARKTIEPIVPPTLQGRVHEQTARVPYFEAIQLLKDADFLVLIGSDDAAYTASKVYPYLLSGRPILAVVHERSGLVPLLRGVPSAAVVTFPVSDERAAIEELASAWKRILESPRHAAPLDTEIEQMCSARDMTQRQCDVFDAVIARLDRASL